MSFFSKLLLRTFAVVPELNSTIPCKMSQQDKKAWKWKGFEICSTQNS